MQHFWNILRVNGRPNSSTSGNELDERGCRNGLASQPATAPHCGRPVTAAQTHPRGPTGAPVNLDHLHLIRLEPPRPHGHLEFDSRLLSLHTPTPCTRGWVKTLPEQGDDICKSCPRGADSASIIPPPPIAREMLNPMVGTATSYLRQNPSSVSTSFCPNHQARPDSEPTGLAHWGGRLGQDRVRACHPHPSYL